MAMLVHIQTMKCKRIYLKCGHITFNNATPGHGEPNHQEMKHVLVYLL